MNRNRWIGAGILAFVAISLIVLGIYGRRGDGIETGKTYTLAYSYKATLKGVGPARVFDFADRNLPRTSIVVPLRDERGMALVEETMNIPSSTVRKVIASVPTRVVEGVAYPGYIYVVWQYHLGTTATQSVVPVVIPRQ